MLPAEARRFSPSQASDSPRPEFEPWINFYSYKPVDKQLKLDVDEMIVRRYSHKTFSFPNNLSHVSTVQKRTLSSITLCLQTSLKKDYRKNKGWNTSEQSSNKKKDIQKSIKTTIFSFNSNPLLTKFEKRKNIRVSVFWISLTIYSRLNKDRIEWSSVCKHPMHVNCSVR